MATVARQDQAKARNLELHPVSHMGGWGPNTEAIFCCFPRLSTESWIGSGAVRTWTGAQWFYSLCHSTNPFICISAFITVTLNTHVQTISSVVNCVLDEWSKLCWWPCQMSVVIVGEVLGWTSMFWCNQIYSSRFDCISHPNKMFRFVWIFMEESLHLERFAFSTQCSLWLLTTHRLVTLQSTEYTIVRFNKIRVRVLLILRY